MLLLGPDSAETIRLDLVISDVTITSRSHVTVCRACVVRHGVQRAGEETATSKRDYRACRGGVCRRRDVDAARLGTTAGRLHRPDQTHRRRRREQSAQRVPRTAAKTGPEVPENVQQVRRSVCTVQDNNNVKPVSRIWFEHLRSGTARTVLLNHTQLALVILCFHNFRLQSCVMKQTTV